MGSRTDRDRIMDLELRLGAIEVRMNGVQSLMGVIAGRIEREDRTMVKKRAAMAKARAARKRGKAIKSG